MPPKILLIDGHSILFRAFYALPLLTNAQGEYTNAVYGFMSIFLKFLDEEKPDHVAIAFDLPEPTFRHKKFEAYKGTRGPVPPEFIPQVPMLMGLLTAMEIPIVTCPGYEADDVLGSLAAKASASGCRSVIVSGDRDLLQLASDTVKIRIPKTKKGGKTEVEDYQADDVLQKYGVTPKAYIDVKALMGDSSDNIPGVPGIGEVTATKIIIAYGSVEEAIAHAPEIKPKKASENLAAFADQALLSKELSTIVCDAPVNYDFDAKPVDMWNDTALVEIDRLGFKSLKPRGVTRRLNGGDASPDPSVGIAFVTEPDGGVFIHGQGLQTIEQARGFLESDTPKLTWDVKREASRLLSNGVDVNGVVFDALLASYVLNESMSELGVEEIAASFPSMRRQLEENDQTYLYDHIELPLAFVLKDMEQYGIKIDKEALIAYGQALDTQIDILTAEIYELTGEVFNIQSPAQLSVILFEKLGLKGSKKTKSGYSTAADVLEGIKDQHPVISKVLAYRSHTKLKSTYVDGLMPLINPVDFRVRSTFNQALTATGRISSAEPNLQNIPVRMPLGRELRKVFIPENDDFIFIDADYSQIELRVLAHMSGDETLINAFHQNQDIHRLTASQVFHTSIDQVQPYQRDAAKTVNFSIIYGISAFSLANDLDITRHEAQMYIDGYFRQYPRVKEYMDKTIAQAKEKGYVSTLFNRRRFMPELKSSNYAMRSFGERAAMNMPIQGTAADIIKIAMIRTAARLKEEGLVSRLILQVHDELLLEVKKSEVDTVRILLKEEMEGAAKLSVPLEIELHEGATWYDAK